MPASPAPPPPAPPASPARRRLFVAVTLLLPWLLLALVELGLRLGGYGGRPPLFVPYAEQPGWMMTNPEFARRYFRGAFVPTPHVDFFRAEKAPGAFRVVFQGESSAAGFPYGHGGAPSRLLEQQLQAAFPGREVEAVNAAFTAINSYAMLDQADDVLAARPDAVLIYAGHNEYYGALGAASTRGLGGRRPLVRRRASPTPSSATTTMPPTRPRYGAWVWAQMEPATMATGRATTSRRSTDQTASSSTNHHSSGM